MKGEYARRVYSYQSDELTLEIGLDGNICLYNEYDLSKPENLPSNEECIEIATEWLKFYGYYPNDVSLVKSSSYMDYEEVDSSTNTTLQKYSLSTVVKFFTDLNGHTYLFLAAFVVIGNIGSLLRADINVLYSLKNTVM